VGLKSDKSAVGKWNAYHATLTLAHVWKQALVTYKDQR
jgi:hypothetical protein